MPRPARRSLLASLACAAISGALVGCDDLGCGSRPSGEGSPSSAASAGAPSGGVAQPGSAPEAPQPSAPPPSASSRSAQAPTGAPPTIASLSPKTCGVAGGEQVVIKGANFAQPQVLFGGSAARVLEASPEELTVVAPPQEHPGTVSIVVTNRAGGYAVAGNAFSYVP